MIRICFATLDDAGLLLRLIRDLAAYERTPNAVVATEEDLRRYGFGPERQFEALLAFLDGERGCRDDRVCMTRRCREPDSNPRSGIVNLSSRGMLICRWRGARSQLALSAPPSSRP